MRLQFIHNLSCSIISGEFVKWRFYQEGRDGAQVSRIVDEDSVQINWWRERWEAGQAVQDLPAVPEILRTEDDFEVSMDDVVCIVFVFHTKHQELQGSIPRVTSCVLCKLFIFANWGHMPNQGP